MGPSEGKFQMAVWRFAAMRGGLFSQYARMRLRQRGGPSGTGGIDPWEKNNRTFYNMNDQMDRVALRPLADLYVRAVPRTIRVGLGHGFDNLGYFNVILNDFLQGNTRQGASDAGRMAANSTIGILGLFDVATRWGMPPHENDFGITLGKWGAAPAGRTWCFRCSGLRRCAMCRAFRSDL